MRPLLTGYHFFRLVEDAFCRAACSRCTSLAAYGLDELPLDGEPGRPPNLPHLLAAVRQSRPEGRLGPKSLYGPARSEGYADLVVDAIGRAWTWRGDAAGGAKR